LFKTADCRTEKKKLGAIAGDEPEK